MAIAIQPRRRIVAHRPRAHRRMTEPESALPLVLLTAIIIVAATLVLTGHLFEISVPRSLIPSMHPAAPTRPTDGAIPVTKLSLTTTSKSLTGTLPDAAENPDVATEQVEVGARARVANTDNQGVVLYAAPRDNARQPAGLLEGTAVSVLEVSGTEWARVQTDSKKGGWVRAAYLAPAE
jgi:hypothetical protein